LPVVIGELLTGWFIGNLPPELAVALALASRLEFPPLLLLLTALPGAAAPRLSGR
jgi:hypothetical protein